MPITLEQLFDKIAEELILDDLGFITSEVVKSNQKTIRNGSFKLGRTGDDKLALYQKDIEANKEDLAYLESDGGIGGSQLSVLENLKEVKLMLTYNVDLGNSNGDFLIDNTILVHRKKQTNTLYTINALNELIKSLNNGVLDKTFSINWNDYKNCILLIQAEGFKKIDTKVKNIINI